MAKNELGITVKKEEDMPEWYSQVVLKSEMAESSAVKGCAVIRPWGYAMWEQIQDTFNAYIKEAGVKNAYFPLFIPESFFMREAEHVEGFAPEVAWIERKSENEERLGIRPTSETIMYDSYRRWIRSHRDLPLRINQWANIVRWEVSDVKLFLRSREFLWQEGHCVYETEEECDKETMFFLNKYVKLSEELLAIPAMSGKKSEKEKFAGAKYTLTFEHFMPDGKALQSGTSHNLGQGFAKSFGISYKGKDGEEHTPWQSSWGISTRLLGSVVMTHGDDKGLVLPPRLAPTQVVVVPVIFKNKPELSKEVLAQAEKLYAELKAAGIRVDFDDREEISLGRRINEWELKGVPLRLEIGPKDIEQSQCVLAKRNDGEKLSVALSDVAPKAKELLDTIHNELFAKAKKFLDEKLVEKTTFDELKDEIKQGNFVLAPHCGEESCEEELKAETGGVTTRCRPFDNDKVNEGDTCIYCGKQAKYKIIFARNY